GPPPRGIGTISLSALRKRRRGSALEPEAPARQLPQAHVARIEAPGSPVVANRRSPMTLSQLEVAEQPERYEAVGLEVQRRPQLAPGAAPVPARLQRRGLEPAGVQRQGIEMLGLACGLQLFWRRAPLLGSRAP